MTESPSQGSPVVSVIVPTYNERARIAELVEAVFEVFHAHDLDGELVVVDDNSPDGTGAIVDALVDRHRGRLRVVHRSGKLGLGTAVMEGFHAAGAPVLGVMDADFSHPPTVVVPLLEVIQRSDADAAIGSRYIPGGGVRNWPASRLLLSRIACLLARPLTPVRDATSGLFLVRREAIDGVAIAAGGFKICLELLIRGRIASVVETPYIFTDRAVGESKMTMREALGYLRQLRQLYAVRFLRGGGRRRPRYRREASDAAAAEGDRLARR